MCIKEFKKKYLTCSSIEKLVGALLGCDFGPFLHTNCLQILFGIIVLLKHPLWFHLHRPGGWQQIFIRNVSVHFSIHPSFSYMKHAVPYGCKVEGMTYYHSEL